MTTAAAPVALARVYRGEWIADCPRPHCGNAEKLAAWQPLFACSNLWCGIQVPVTWPPDAGAILEVLRGRGAAQWMNWFPAGHPVAVAAGCPHGQTVDDLITESAEHAEELEAWHWFGQHAMTGTCRPPALS